MNSSLRDQLLAAGLVTEKQARQAEHQEQQRQFRKHHTKGGGQNRPPQPQRSDAQGRPQPQQPGTQGRSHAAAGAQGTSQPQQPGTQGRPQAAAGAQGTPQPQQPPSPKVLAQQAQAAKIERDKELNRRREDKAQRRARIAQIEQIIEQHRLPRLETDDYYSFIDGKKIRRMSVDAQRREQLTKRELVIVRYKGHYAVVPAEIAEKIRERDENMVVPLVQPQNSPEAVDEAYKDFVVPDDLMW